MGKPNGCCLSSPRHIFYFCLALFFVFFPGLIFSGNELGNPLIRNYSPEEYKAHPQNWAICQDSRGMIYVGNIYGLLEYDGKNWQLIELANHSAVNSLAVDRQDRLYIGGNNEIGYLASQASGKNIYVSLNNTLKPNDKQFTTVIGCHPTSQGVYFVTGGKIFFWHEQKMEVIPFLPSSVGTVVDDRFVIVDQSGAIQEFIASKPRLIAQSPELRLEKAALCILLPYHRNEILIIAQNNTFFVCRPAAASPGDRLTKLSTGELSEFFRFHPIIKALSLTADRFALAVDCGIIIIDGDGKLIQFINKNRGLQDEQIHDLMLDREENLWATLNYGISRIEINSPLSQFSAANGLDGIMLVSARHKGRLYAGNFKGISYLKDYHLDIRDDKQQFLPLKNCPGDCFDLINSGDVFLGIAGVTICLILDDQAIPIITTQGVFSACCSKRFPHHVFFGHQNGIFAAKILAPTGAAESLNKNGNQIQVKIFQTGNFQAVRGFIRKVISDGNGDIWASSEYDGIYCLKFQNTNIEDFKIFHFTERNGLPGNPKNTVHFIDNQLLVGTEKGLYRAIMPQGNSKDYSTIRFVPETNIGKVFLKKPQRVLRVARDHDGDYWMSLMYPGGFAISFKNKDGSYRFDDVPFREIKGYIENFQVEEDGVGWLSAVESRALFRFDKKIIKNYQRDYHTLIRHVTCGTETVIFSGNYYDPHSRSRDLFLQPSLVQPPALQPTLTYRDNSLLFEYSAAFFESPERTRFQYQLEGFAKEWSPWTEKTEKEYGSLLEGHYCFKVKAKNIFDHESDVAMFAFIIAPPWYRTFWAYAIYVILFILVMYGGIRLNTRRLQLAKKRLEKIVAARTAEVVRQRDEISQKKDEISKQKDEIESYAGELYNTNHQLKMARDALWGEMELAKKIQTVLLPEEPQIPGYEISAYMKPADEVGGDYYDVINFVWASRLIGTPLHAMPQHWVVIGDVSGHGVPAGLVMMMAQTSIRSILQANPDLSVTDMLIKMNAVIYENIRKLGEEKYMTITLMSVQNNGTIYFSGLHQDIMIYRASRQQVELVETRGMWIGLMNDITGMIALDFLNLNPGDAMLLYTDGITEAIDQAGHLFSEEKLQQVFLDSGSQNPEQIKQNIIKSLNGYTCADDVTLLILQRI